MTPKTEVLTLRMRPDIKDKVQYIKRTTRMQISDIFQKMIESTTIDEKCREFYTNCSSKENGNLKNLDNK